MDTPSTHQNARVVIATALISAVTTLAVALITRLPEIVENWTKPASTWQIRGKVEASGTGQPLTQAKIDLAQDTLTTATTDDQGSFTFTVPPGDYSITVRDPNSSEEWLARVNISPPRSPFAEILNRTLIAYEIDE